MSRAVMFQKQACQPCVLFQWLPDQKQKEQGAKADSKSVKKGQTQTPR